MKYPPAYKTAVALQRLIAKDAEGQTGKDLAAIAGSFVKLEMLKLRLRMKPAPKPIDVTPKAKHHAPTAEPE